MINTMAAPPAPSPKTPALQLVCSEVWGGNRPINGPVELPGLHGVLYSNPCQGIRGGDVHYLSVCGSGLLSRVCLADVAGHGETVAAVGDEMHKHLRRCMNQVDQRKVLGQLNRRLEALGLHAMTTAAAITYYPPTKSLSVSYAGHPPGWYYSHAANAWSRLTLDEADEGAPVNLPLAIDPEARYTRRAVKAEVGDRLLLVTDGVLEAPSAGRELFGDDRVEHVLRAEDGAPCERIAVALRSALAEHCRKAVLDHDDVSFAVLEIGPGPSEPAWWLAVRNRITRPRGNGDDPAFAVRASR